MSIVRCSLTETAPAIDSFPDLRSKSGETIKSCLRIQEWRAVLIPDWSAQSHKIQFTGAGALRTYISFTAKADNTSVAMPFSQHGTLNLTA
jgi:hypothetical protein